MGRDQSNWQLRRPDGSLVKMHHERPNLPLDWWPVPGGRDPADPAAYRYADRFAGGETHDIPGVQSRRPSVSRTAVSRLDGGQTGPCVRACSAYPITNERPAALIPINNASNPDRGQPDSDHLLFAAPMAKNPRPVAATHQARL